MVEHRLNSLIPLVQAFIAFSSHLQPPIQPGSAHRDPYGLNRALLYDMLRDAGRECACEIEFVRQVMSNIEMVG